VQTVPEEGGRMYECIPEVKKINFLFFVFLQGKKKSNIKKRKKWR
jgi:hypothetical protein